MFQSEMSDLTLGISPELLLLGHEEEIDNNVSEILLQDFNDFQNLSFSDQTNGLSKEDLMDEAIGDMFYLSAKPSDITGQSLAVTMEDDKNKVLNSMAIQTSTMMTENKSDMVEVQQPTQNWMESTVVELEQQSKEVNSFSSNDGNEIHETQDVIDEIQDFLDQFVDEDMEKDEEGRNLADDLLSLEQKTTLNSMDMLECPLANSTMNDEETSAAEDLLDQLIRGNFTGAEIKQFEQQSVSTQDDTGYSSFSSSYDVSNVSEFVTDDGQRVIIVITPSSQDEVEAITTSTPSTVADTPSPSILPSSGFSNGNSGIDDEASEEDGNYSSGDDSEWLPEADGPTRQSQFKVPKTPDKSKPGRKMQERKRTHTSTSSNGRISKIRSIHDRKERKKLQNVEAARRYRDKKKAEEALVGDEEKGLVIKNSELKTQLNGIEGELNTLKKLMKELGLIKFVTSGSSSHVQ